MPITIDIVVGYEGDKPIINLDKVEEWVLKKFLHSNIIITKFAFKQNERRSIYTTHRARENTKAKRIFQERKHTLEQRSDLGTARMDGGTEKESCCTTLEKQKE